MPSSDIPASYRAQSLNDTSVDFNKSATSSLQLAAAVKELTIQDLREDLDLLKNSVTELASLVDTLPSSPRSCTGETTAAADVDVTTGLLHTENFTKFEEERAESKAFLPRYQCSVEANGTAYALYTCSHCTTDTILVSKYLLDLMQSKISDLALRGLKQAKEKGHVVQASRVAEHKANRDRKRLKDALANTERERNLSVQDADEARSQLNSAWWELATVKYMQEGLASTLETVTTEALAMQEALTSARSQHSIALHNARDLESKLELCMQEASGLTEQLQKAQDKLSEATAQFQDERIEAERRGSRDNCLLVFNNYPHQRLAHEERARTEAEEGSEEADIALAQANNQVQDLQAENSRLKNVDADCQALAESRTLPPSFERAMTKMRYLELRNTYLEERLRVYESEREGVRAGASQTTRSAGSSPSSCQEGRGWTLSLRSRRRQADEEEGAMCHYSE